MAQTIVIGLLGSILDNTGQGQRRWERWRPTIGLCQQEDLVVHRLELLYQPQNQTLLDLICRDIALISPETDIRPHPLPIANPWDFEEVFELLHDFSRTVSLEQDDDLLVHITTGTHVAQICLFLLTEAGYFPGRLIQTGPGRGRAASPAGRYTIIDLDLSRYDRIASRFQQESQDDISFLKSGIQTRSRTFNDLIARIEQVAVRSSAPILLTGPTGAGKSRLAQRIYELKRAKRRLQGAFVEVNCATLQGEHGMAALFGHTRGAFTGAIAERAGLLRTADGGVLFLDEIGELGADEQAMLLRALEAKRFLPVGADIEVASDFQLICGTNRDLHGQCRQGTFREDLLSRINLWTFDLPGLRDRVEDVEPNLDYELERFTRNSGTRITINREARERFLAFAASSQALWTGNFRDLGAAVTRMATLAPRGRITQTEVEEEIGRLRGSWSVGDRAASNLSAGIQEDRIGRRLDLFDRLQLEQVLDVCRRCSSLAEAGRLLFAVSRTGKSTRNDSDRLRKYLAKYNISWQDVQAMDHPPT